MFGVYLAVGLGIGMGAKPLPGVCGGAGAACGAAKFKWLTKTFMVTSGVAQLGKA